MTIDSQRFDRDLIELLKRNEGKTLEFKRDLSSSDKVIRTLVAFSNTAGGILLIGVEDKTHAVCGVLDALKEEERLANVISDNIEPRLAPEIEIIRWRKTQVLCVQVFPSSSRPHFLKSLGIEKGVFVRVGSTNRIADEPLIEELRRAVRLETFDEQPMVNANSEELDFRLASESFEPVRKLAKHDLETLRLLTTHHGRKVPTIGGIILFGKNRDKLFPDAWIQAGRFAGKDKARITDSVEIRTCLIRAVEDAIAFVQKHDMQAMEIGPVRRKNRWRYPALAVREAIINAVVHADYSQRGAPIRISIFDDRLEVENPGLLLFGLTIDDMQRGISKLRNRVIGRVFRELDLIEQWGSGIQRMTEACLEAGLDPPVFEEISTHFRVTIRLQKRVAFDLDKIDTAILDALRKSSLNTDGLAKVIGISTRATRTRALRLVQRELIIEVRKNPNDPRMTYVLKGNAD